ncbi:hypothetical protein VNI00_017841 [Paramarasmius palmivorus]|uniref:Uncharacterized protein n=1 Tax=Paramarasmius palmivorus TaxID=297713 RepID=A0AAW0B341_9AGAR
MCRGIPVGPVMNTEDDGRGGRRVSHNVTDVVTPAFLSIRSPVMAPKRKQKGRVYRDRIENDDDFDIDIIPAREERVLVDGRIGVVDYSPGKGRMEWNRSSEWTEERWKDFALDSSNDLYDAVLNADIFEEVGVVQEGMELLQGKKRKRKSMRAVSILLGRFKV